MDLYIMKGILIFSLCLISVPGRRARQVKAFISGGILIFCKFDGQHEGRYKYFCKGRASACQLVNDTRVSQYENVQGDYLTILITNLTVDDAGTYHCGVDDRVIREEIVLSVKPGDCCDSVITITGQEGEDISVDCKYPEKSVKNIKHFCKQNQRNIESDLLQSKPSDTSQKYSQYDNKSASVYTVTIHKLDKNNAGIYWCGVRTGQSDVALTTQVNLTITGRKKNPVSLKGFTMGGILILCNFYNKDKDKKKYFCKGNLTTCHNNRLAHNNDSRFFQYENEEKDHLTVLLTNLTTEDAGTYHCAAEDGELHTAFSLKIKEDVCCDSPVSTVAHEGGNISILCKYPEESKGNIKYFLKQHEEFTDLIDKKSLHKNSKYSLFENKSINVFTVMIHKVGKDDAGIYWCGVRTGGNNVALTQQVKLEITDTGKKSVMIPVLVVTVALIGVILCTLCYRHRYRKKLDRSTGVIYHKTENLDPDRIYEEIEDIGLPPPPWTSSCSYTKMSEHQASTGDPTYYTIKSPPNLSDDTGHHVTSMKTDPQSSTVNTIYTTAGLPAISTYSNIQSLTHGSGSTCLIAGTSETDCAVNTVYVNAQAPIDPSDCSAPFPNPSDTASSVIQEPTDTYTNTVCNISHSPTRTSDDTESSITSGPTSSQIHTVYITTKFATDRNEESTDNNVQVPTNLNNATMCADKEPLQPKRDPTQLTVQEETKHTANSAVYIPPDTTHTEHNTTELHTLTDEEHLYPDSQVPIEPDNECTHLNVHEATNSEDDHTGSPIHVPLSPSCDQRGVTFQCSTNPSDYSNQDPTNPVNEQTNFNIQGPRQPTDDPSNASSNHTDVTLPVSTKPSD